MAVVGDRVQVPSKRVGQTPREGVVTAVTGGLVQVTWLGGEQSTMVPTMGSLVVVGKAKVRAQKKAPTKKAPAKKTSSTNARPKKVQPKAAKGSARGKRASAAKASSRVSGGAARRRK
jgi:hypothetical protein